MARELRRPVREGDYQPPDQEYRTPFWLAMHADRIDAKMNMIRQGLA